MVAERVPEYSGVNWQAPLQLADGRIFDVLQWQVCYGSGTQRLCLMEVFHRGSDFTHLFFHLYFCRTLYERGRREEESLLTLARVRVWDYLNRNRQPVPLSRWAQPIVLRCE